MAGEDPEGVEPDLNLRRVAAEAGLVGEALNRAANDVARQVDEGVDRSSVRCGSAWRG